MKHFSTRVRLGGATLLLSLTVPVAFADQVQMAIKTAPLGLTYWGGEYVSPYSAVISKKTNGIIDGNTPDLSPFINLSVVCLDIAENTYVDAKITYDLTYNTGDAYLPALDPSPSMQKRYDGAARLAAELLATSTLTGADRGMLSFAIWYIFNNNALNATVLDPYRNDIKKMAEDAIKSGTSVRYTVYTPPSDGTGLRDLRSQRFIGNVTVPEPPAVALLGLNMSGLLGLVLVLRRRSRRS